MENAVFGASEARILIVESCSMQAAYVRTLLEQQGYNVFLAADGQMGLQMARKCYPDIIVLNLDTPEMNSFQLCFRLKKRCETSTIPIIMLSQDNGIGTEHQSLRIGSVDYIHKGMPCNRCQFRDSGRCVPCDNIS